MITKIPKLLTANKRKLTEIFDYVHNVMSIPHHVIVRFPQVMHTLCRSCPCPLCLELLSRLALFTWEDALLFVKELDQMQSSSENWIKVIFLFLIFLSRAHLANRVEGEMACEKFITSRAHVSICRTEINDGSISLYFSLAPR